MAIQHMTAKQLAAFKLDREAKVDSSVPAPEGVTILQMTGDVPGIVVALDDGKGGAYVVGDSVGVYWGDEVPPYFA